MNREAVEQLVAQMADAWMQHDVAASLLLFTDDGQFISPGGAVQGHAALAATATSYFAEISAVQVTITRVLVDGAQAAVEWTWQETARVTGEQRTMNDAIIFEIQAGKIAYWREYFDPAQQPS